MPLVVLEDSTILEFDSLKYSMRRISFGIKTFALKPEFASCNRPTKIVLDFIKKTYYEEFVDGHQRTLKYAEVI